MQEINKMEFETTLRKRRLLVLGSSLMVLWFWIEGFIFLWFHSSGPTGYAANWIFTIAAIISFICQYRLYRSNTTHVVSASGKEIDERQKMIRDQAYRHAYQIIIGIVLITLPLMVLPIYLNPAYLGQSLGGIILPFIGLLWSMMLLPTWVVAWTERSN